MATTYTMSEVSWPDGTEQIASASQAAVTMGATATTTALRAELDEVAVLANALRAALVTAGIIKGAA